MASGSTAATWRRSAARLFMALLAGSLLAACGEPGPQFKNVDITGAEYGKDFHLKDAGGKARSLADFRGKVVVMFFGYTHCPDVCPLTMAELRDVMKRLGDQRSRVQVLFVTLDPERDTGSLLAQYVPAFDKEFIGLYGDAQATAETARAFRVFYQKQPGKTPDSYTLDHTAATYVFDPQGRLRLFVRYDQDASEKHAEDLASDIRTLLTQK
jgi:protein SCO1/2